MCCGGFASSLLGLVGDLNDVRFVVFFSFLFVGGFASSLLDLIGDLNDVRFCVFRRRLRNFV